MMPGPEPLQQEQNYHVYNRGINGEPLFRAERSYRYLLRLWAKYIEPIAETHAYCLLNNRFHVLVHIREIGTGPICKIGPVCSRAH